MKKGWPMRFPSRRLFRVVVNETGGVSGYEVTPSKPLVYSVPVEDGVPWGIR